MNELIKTKLTDYQVSVLTDLLLMGWSFETHEEDLIYNQ